MNKNTDASQGKPQGKLIARDTYTYKQEVLIRMLLTVGICIKGQVRRAVLAASTTAIAYVWYKNKHTGATSLELLIKDEFTILGVASSTDSTDSTAQTREANS